jgi:hypothetical protein
MDPDLNENGKSVNDDELDLTQEALVDNLRDYGFSYEQAIHSLIISQWNFHLALNNLLTTSIPSSPPELTTSLSSDSQEKLDIYSALYGDINQNQVKDILLSIGIGYREGYLSAEQRATLKYDLLNGVGLNVVQSQIQRLQSSQATTSKPSRNYLAPREGIQLQRHLSSSTPSSSDPSAPVMTTEEDLCNELDPSFLPPADPHAPASNPSPLEHELLHRRIEITDQDQEYQESLANDSLKFLQKYSSKLRNYSLICRRYQLASNYRQWKDESLQRFKSSREGRVTGRKTTEEEAYFLRLSIQFPKENLFPFPTSVPFASTQHLLKMQSLFAQYTIPTVTRTQKEIFYFTTQSLISSSHPPPPVASTAAPSKQPTVDPPPARGERGQGACQRQEQEEEGEGQSKEKNEEKEFLLSQQFHFYSALDSKIQEFINERWVKQIEILPDNLLFRFSKEANASLEPEFVIESRKYLTKVMNQNVKEQQGQDQEQSPYFYSNQEEIMKLYRDVMNVSSPLSHSPTSRHEMSQGLSYTVSLVYPRTPLYRMKNGQITLLYSPAPGAASVPCVPALIPLFGIDPRGDNLTIEDFECSWNVVFGYDYNRAE